MHLGRKEYAGQSYGCSVGLSRDVIAQHNPHLLFRSNGHMLKHYRCSTPQSAPPLFLPFAAKRALAPVISRQMERLEHRSRLPVTLIYAVAENDRIEGC